MIVPTTNGLIILIFTGTKTTGSGNTTNLIKHCRHYHSAEYEIAEERVKEEKARQAQMQPSKMTNFFSTLTKVTSPAGRTYFLLVFYER